MSIGDAILLFAAMWGVWDLSGRLLRRLARIPVSHVRPGCSIVVNRPLAVADVSRDRNGCVWVTFRSAVFSPDALVEEV